MALTVEQERALALARARRRRAQQEAATPEQPSGFLPFVNQGIASALGAPVDAVNQLLGATGLPVSERPFLGSQHLTDLMQGIGVQPAAVGQSPETLSEYAGQGVGAAAGALPLAFGLLSRGAQSARPLVKGVAESIRRPFFATPGRALATEAAAGGGAGAGQYVAQESAPESQTAQVLGPLLGAATAGMGPNLLVRGAQQIPLVQYGLNVAASEVAPFTQSGALARARSRVSNLVEDRDAALRALDAGSTGGLSPAVTTGDPHLMALERAVRGANPPIDRSMRQSEEVSRALLLDTAQGIGAGGDISATRQALSDRVQPLVDRMQARVAKAEADAARRVQALEPQRRGSASSAIVREELEKALADARKQEETLWRQVPQDELVSTRNSRQAFDAILRDTPRAQQEDIPQIAREFLSGSGNRAFKGSESAKEVHGLYSKLRETERQLRADRQWNSARIANTLANSLLDDLNSSAAVRGPLRDALDFSLELNRRFSQGNVGRVLRPDSTGGDRVAPELTLQTTVGRGGPAGGVAIDEIRAALGGDSPAIPDFVRAQLTDAAVRGGALSPQRAETFMRRNEDILRRTPEVQNQVAEALLSQERASRTAQTMAGRQQGLQQGSAGRLLSAPEGGEFQAIMRSPNPPAMARQLVQQVRRDQSGAALDGLKQSTVRDILEGATTRQFTEEGVPAISGRAMAARLRDPQFEAVAREILSPDEMERLRTVANEFAKLETSQGSLPTVSNVMEGEPNSLIMYFARVLAARGGARLGKGTSGASLQTAQMASNRMQRLLQFLSNDKAEDLIVRAVSGDADLFRSLLEPVNKLSRQQENRIIETLLGARGQELGSRERREENDVATALVRGSSREGGRTQ